VKYKLLPTRSRFQSARLSASRPPQRHCADSIDGIRPEMRGLVRASRRRPPSLGRRGGKQAFLRWREENSCLHRRCTRCLTCAHPHGIGSAAVSSRHVASPPPLPPPPATFRTDTRAHLFRRRRPARWRTTMERAPIRFVAGMRPQHRGCRTLERKREFAIRVDSCSAGG